MIVTTGPATVTLDVRGTPVPQGNHKAFKVGGHIKITDKAGGGLTAWRHAIATEARAAMGDMPCLTGPLWAIVVFRLARPASAPKRRRTWPIGQRSGDADKLLRAVGDALSGVVYLDDAQLVSVAVSKDYGDPGVHIEIGEVGA